MPDSGSDVTLGELHRRLTDINISVNSRFLEFQSRMDAGFRAINEHIASQAYVHIDRYDADRRADKQRFELIDQRHDEIKETTRRLWWLVVAAVIGLIGEAVLFLALTRGGP